jgi:hypothetical protein
MFLVIIFYLVYDCWTLYFNWKMCKKLFGNYKLDWMRIERDRSLDCSFKSYIFVWIGKDSHKLSAHSDCGFWGIYLFDIHMVCIPNKTFQINWHYSLHFSWENESFSAHGYVEYMKKTLADRTPGWLINVNDHICLQYLNSYNFFPVWQVLWMSEKVTQE